MIGYRKSTRWELSETDDYSIFHKLNGNRKINKNTIRQVRECMKEFGNLPCLPLVYRDRNGTLYVADGQHRIDAAQELNEWVYFIIIDENIFKERPDDENKALLRLCQEINNCSHNWSIDDYVDSYVDNGNKDYMKIKNWKTKYPFITYSMLQAMLGSKCTTAGSHGGRAFKDVNLRKGILDISEPLENLMNESLEYLESYSKYIDGIRGKGRKEDWYTFFLKLKTPIEGSTDWHRVNLIFEENRMTKNLGGIDAIYPAFEAVYNKSLPKSSFHFMYDNIGNIFFRQKI